MTTMHVTHLGRDAGESYKLRKGHDPDWDLDILVRTYADSHETVSFRPGKDDTAATWGPEIAVEAIPC